MSGSPNVQQTIFPNKEPLPPSGSPANKTLARKLLKDGKKALDAGDIESARRFALQAKELRPDLEWWEDNPDRLLADVQRRAGSKTTLTQPAPTLPTPQVAVNNPNNSKPAAAAQPTGDAKKMVRDGRVFLDKNKLDEAEKLCAQATAVQPKGWRLFEDSPDKLRADIQKARTKADQEEAAKLLAEARKLYALGNFHEAKVKAYRAQQLHGPYTDWSFGDRPQRLLDEIQRAEAKGAPQTNVPKNTDPLKGPVAPGTPGAVAQNTKPGVQPNDPSKKPAPLVSGTAQAAVKIRAVALVQEARDLQRKGQLIEARAKAVEAEQLRASFGAEEDSPAGVLVSLSAQCDRMVDQLLQRAADQVRNTNDPMRFQRAEADINAARQMAQTFKLDGARIEQRATWLRQAAATSSVQPMAAQGGPLDNRNVVQAAAPQLQSPVSTGDANLDRIRQMGFDKLEKARLELRAGNYPVARRLAEEAFTQHGLQQEASALLRSIDADVFNHNINLAQRNADAGLQAYARRDYRQAAGILAAVDVKLLPPDLSRRIGEIMNTPEMQPIRLVGDKQPPTGPLASNSGAASPGMVNPGMATATDDQMASFKAMQQIQMQQMRDRGLVAEKTAIEYVKNGQKDKAVDVLKDYLSQLTSVDLDPQQLALLRSRAENRLNQYQVMMQQDAIARQATNSTSSWDETKYQASIRKTQEEVAVLIKEYRVLHKEGKYKEALAAAQKAKELDPDNLAADAAIQITTIAINQKDYADGRSRNEKLFLKQLNPDPGAYVDGVNPVSFDEKTMQRMQNRKGSERGIWSQTRDPIERAIERRLDEPISVNFKDTPLRQVISDLQSLSGNGMNIVPDTSALQDASISLEQPLSLSVDKISLKSVLNILLDQVKLTYVIKDQALQITTKEKAKGRMKMVTYQVTDLVVPVDNHPVAGINDLNTALARHLQAANGVVNQSASPYSPASSLTGGTTVSSPGSGAGTSFASNQAGGPSPAQMVPPRAPGHTIEELLINMIQNSCSPTSWNSVGGQGTINYYPLGNALVVNQTQEVQEEVLALLQSLRRLQDLEIAIEMRLVSVSEDFFERIGLDFDVNLRTPTSRNEVALTTSQFTPFGTVNRNLDRLRLISGLTPAGTLTPDLNIPIRNSSFDFSIPPFGQYPGTLGADGGLSLGLAFLSDIQVFMFLEAAQGDRRMNVMQAPKLTVFNGQTANIQIQDQQFFLTGVTVQAAGPQLFFLPNNQPFPLGVSMQVTPVVSADRRFVRLNLAPQLTNLANATVPLIPIQVPVPQLLDGPGNAFQTTGQPAIFQMFFQQPTFTTITLDTTVNVPDGGTVLLGGLKTMAEGRNEFGPPVLSKIPYLSRLFRNVAYGREGQSLMIMVTPRIIINEEEEQIFLGNLQVPRP